MNFFKLVYINCQKGDFPFLGGVLKNRGWGVSKRMCHSYSPFYFSYPSLIFPIASIIPHPSPLHLPGSPLLEYPLYPLPELELELPVSGSAAHSLIALTTHATRANCPAQNVVVNVALRIVSKSLIPPLLNFNLNSRRLCI